MKRVGFKPKMAARPAREDRVRPPLTPIRQVAPFALSCVPTPKTELVRSEDYRRYVAAMPCFLCSVSGHSQAAHADQGKAMAQKTCDLTCYALCGPRMGDPGCHYRTGSAGEMNRGQRRALEIRAAAATQAALIEQAAGDRKLRAVLVKVGLIGGAA